MPAADDQRAITQLRPVPFLDCRIEGVTIYMTNAQFMQFRVCQEAWRAAIRAPAWFDPGRSRKGCLAFAAKGEGDALQFGGLRPGKVVNINTKQNRVGIFAGFTIMALINRRD